MQIKLKNKNKGIVDFMPDYVILPEKTKKEIDEYNRTIIRGLANEYQYYQISGIDINQAKKLVKTYKIRGLIIGDDFEFIVGATANARMINSISSDIKNQEKRRNASKDTLLRIANGRERAKAFYVRSCMK